MPTRRGTLYGMLSCLLLYASEQSSAGKLFEWRDKDGTRQFSDRAPAGLPFSERSFSSISGTPGSEIEPGIRKAEHILLENARHQLLEINRERQALAQQTEQRNDRCRQARIRYHEVIHRTGTAGSSDFRTYRRKMNESCD
jgi:hypothetical protein